MVRKSTKTTGCQAPLPALGARPLLSAQQAHQLETLFKVLGNDTRLRLLHALERAGELGVSSLAATLQMKPQAVSNQLQRLSDLGIVSSRRDGNCIYYRLANGCVAPLLDLALCLTEAECDSTKPPPMVQIAIVAQPPAK